MPRTVRLTALLASFALLAFSASGALAYGASDHPLAQLEFSGNCDNPSFALCSPQGVGTGGIWLWIEIDAGGTGDVAGAGCGHTVGGGGAGAGSIRGTVTWVPATTSQLSGYGAFPVGTDPNGNYYVVFVGPGEAFAFPMTQGHYSSHPAPGVALEAQVAP